MDESSKQRPVVFAGENPIIQLYLPGDDRPVAGASTWRSTFSEAGVGYVLFLYVDPEVLGSAGAGTTGIYVDNPDLRQLVWKNFNQHFESYKNRGFEKLKTRSSRFVETAGGRDNHTIVCVSGATTIELRWESIQDVFHNSDTFNLGGVDRTVNNVVCPAASASITINGERVPGEVKETGGAFQRSAFLAFCESWIRRSEA